MGEKLTDGKISADCRQHFRAVRDTLDMVSGKWKVLLIACLATGKKRYLELQRVVEGIGTKMLSRELQELELNGLITRTVMDSRPMTVEYELTAYGKTLKPIIDEMAAWGKQHREKVIKEMTGN